MTGFVAALKAYLFQFLAGVLLVAFLVQTARLQLAEVRQAKALQQHAETLKGIADLTAKTADLALKAQQAAMRVSAAIDLQRSQERDHAISRIENDRAAVARGDSRLRVAATCPATRGPDVPQGTTAPSVDAEAAPRLTEDAQQAYFDLSKQFAEVKAQLLFFQDREAQRASAQPAEP